MTNLSAALKVFRFAAQKSKCRPDAGGCIDLINNYIKYCKEGCFPKARLNIGKQQPGWRMSTVKKTNQDDIGDMERADYLAFQEKVRGSNINDQTLLATDYLNHFNEIVMLLEMVPDMPEILEDAKEWQPRGYQEHMVQSTFSDRELAAEAYDHVPGKFREPFEKTVAQTNTLIATSIERLQRDLERGDMDLLRENAVALSQVIQRLMEIASGIINGGASTMDQTEVDTLIG
jgi:hypothetical protein